MSGSINIYLFVWINVIQLTSDFINKQICMYMKLKLSLIAKTKLKV